MIARILDCLTIIIGFGVFVLSVGTMAWLIYIGFYGTATICAILAVIMLWLSVSTIKDRQN